MRKKPSVYKLTALSGVMALFGSCAQSTSQQNPSNELANQPSQFVFQQGWYSYKCSIDSQVILDLYIHNNSATLSSQGKSLTHGDLTLDTTNYDLADSVYTFVVKEATYAFTKRGTGLKNSLLLYNEDYKKLLSFCSDSKSFLFVKN